MVISYKRRKLAWASGRTADILVAAKRLAEVGFEDEDRRTPYSYSAGASPPTLWLAAALAS